MARPVAQSLASELVVSELDCLRALLRQPDFLGPCLEVGTAAGGTLCEMMACFPDGDRPRFTVVDNMQYFVGQAEAVRRNLRAHGLDPAQVDFRVCSSDEAFLRAENRRETYGFILIDACHKIRQITQDLRWTRLLRVGGAVCLHDYGGPHLGVTLAADRFLRRHLNYRRESLANTLLVLRKTGPGTVSEIGAADHLWANFLAPWLQLQASAAKRRRRLAGWLATRG